ncbi:DUF2971 domain-containing protein [Agrobacterium radiobacter]|uniref:DUF2971 domain-containing protein n=1 Tax=Agrobacterium radiobacter TaxID=362 RepID=A0ABD5LV32_AGRRD
MSAVDPKNYINVINIDQPIYRTYSAKRFVALLKTGSDALVNPAMWEDPFENFFLKSNVQVSATEVASLENLASDWYGQCWTINEDTDALWRIYSHDQTGVKVRSTIRKLFDNLVGGGGQFERLQYYVGTVAYHDLSEIEALMRKITFSDISFGGSNDKFAQLLCVKRKAFSHEAEVRLLFNDVAPKKGSDGVYLYPLDANAIFDEVVLDPRLDASGFADLKSDILTAGCSLTITQSDLYRAPRFTIPI